VPPGIKLIRIDRKSGLRASGEGGGTILEAFKPGTAPPDSYSIIGASGGTLGVSPESDRAVTTGTGGLY
jgi:penicillin-binding protein 1A